jgi:hypothetical protein
MSCRLVHRGGRPGFFPTGNNGSSTAHCASVRSARPATTTLATRSPVIMVVLVDDRSTGDLTYLINDTPIKTSPEPSMLVSTSKHGLVPILDEALTRVGYPRGATTLEGTG